MALIEVNWSPSGRELRQFAGLWLPAFFALVGGLIWYHEHALPFWVMVLWAVAGVVSLSGLVKPARIRPVFLVWMALAYPIGWAVSYLLFVVIFYLVLTPIGLILRVLGRDPMERRIDRSITTYWVPHNPGGDTARYFRQL